MKTFLLTCCGLAILTLISTPARAGHHGCGGLSIGIGVGAPVYRPWYPYYGYGYYPYYYRPYPVVVAPPPVIVQPAPVIQQVPVVQPAPVYQAPPPRTVSQSNSPDPSVDHHLQMLTNPDENARIDSVMTLGRMQAPRAIDPLAATLAGDVSPKVREAAARALGLIGSTQGLPALQRAAQADIDHDVRRSAQFAAEVIQTRR